MKRPFIAVAWLVLALTTSACIYWPPEPRQDMVSHQLAQVPSKQSPTETFAYFRYDYERNRREWETWADPAIKTLLAFQPGDDWQMHEFLSFVCYLADRDEPRVRDYLNTVTVHRAGRNPDSLLHILASRQSPFETYFEQNRVVEIARSVSGGYIITVEPGGRG